MLHAFICICTFPEPFRLQQTKPFSVSTYKTPAIKELFKDIQIYLHDRILQDPVLQSGTVSE